MTELIVITGPMFSNKTARLIEEAADAVVADNTVLVISPTTDDREERHIFTRIRERINGSKKVLLETISNPEKILELTDTHHPDLILIDEGQFLGQTTPIVIQRILDQRREEDDFKIFVGGLDTDFRRELFGPMPALIAMADKVIKLKAICNKCRRKKAIHTWRKGDSTLQVVVGGAGLYEARCRKCYEEK